MAVSGERFSQAANRLQARMWPICVPLASWREAMSSSMRWRRALTVVVVAGSEVVDVVADAAEVAVVVVMVSVMENS